MSSVLVSLVVSVGRFARVLYTVSRELVRESWRSVSGEPGRTPEFRDADDEAPVEPNTAEPPPEAGFSSDGLRLVVE